MKLGRIIRTAAALCAVLVATAAGLAGAERQTVFGRMQPAADDGQESGRYRLSWIENDRGRVTDRVEVSCKHLDTTADDQGAPPSYHLWLTTQDGGTEADFGEMILTRRGAAGFRLDTRRDTLPEGVESVADFGGGVIEVRHGDTVVLEAAIPTFRGPGDSNGSGSGAVGVRRDRSRLVPASRGSRARGSIDAYYANRPDQVREWMRVVLVGLQPSGSPYTVVAIDGDSNETTLFELNTRGRSGAANDTIDTQDGDAIPGDGGVQALSGQSVEVRDKDGAVVLTGTFPDMAVE